MKAGDFDAPSSEEQNQKPAPIAGIPALNHPHHELIEKLGKLDKDDLVKLIISSHFALSLKGGGPADVSGPGGLVGKSGISPADNLEAKQKAAFSKGLPPMLVEMLQPGMTIRDWFAGLAMQGMLTNPEYTQGYEDAIEELNQVSQTAFLQADAMLAARKESE